MAHIQDRGTEGNRKRWQARHRTPAGEERTRSFERKVDARRWLVHQEASKQRGTWVDPTAGQRSFDEWADQWLSTRQVRPSTLAREEGFLRNHIRPAFGALSLAEISQPAVAEWVRGLVDKGLAAATVRKGYQILSAVMQSAVDARVVGRTPCTNVSLPSVHRTEMRFLTAAEVARLADAIDPRYRAAVLVLAWGGLRIGELTALSRRRWHRLNRTLEVTEGVTWVRGEPVWGPPKTEAGHRRIVLPQHVADELDRHVDQRVDSPQELRVLDERERWTTVTRALLFPSPEGKLLRRNQFRRRQFLPAVEACGLDPLRLHDLRHTAVSLWIAAGADVKTVQVRGGWSTVTTPLNRYAHLYPDRDAVLADRLDELASDAREAAEGVVDLGGRRRAGGVS